jgi:hypothetical protein
MPFKDRRSAAIRRPAGQFSIFIQDLLLLNHPDSISDADRAERRLVRDALLQLKLGPVMAKGLVDTASSRYCPLLLASTKSAGSPVRFRGWALTSLSCRKKPGPTAQSWRNCLVWAGSTP